jgi:hypothetical protein
MRKLSDLIHADYDRHTGSWWEVEGPKGGYDSGRCLKRADAYAIAREWYPELEDDLNDKA